MVQRSRQVGDKTYMVDYDWEKVEHSLNPDTKDLPMEDRLFFEGKVKFLIGKEVKLSNIEPKRMKFYKKKIKWVIKIMRYPQLLSRDFVRYELTELLADLGIELSKEALAWKYGPMGFQHKQEYIKQELVNIPTEV